jgi:hypothetical protein
MPTQAPMMSPEWRNFPVNASGNADFSAGIQAALVYTHRARSDAVHQDEAKTRYALDGTVDRYRSSSRVPHTFVISSSSTFKRAVYLALTYPLRELGA